MCSFLSHLPHLLGLAYSYRFPFNSRLEVVRSTFIVSRTDEEWVRVISNIFFNMMCSLCLKLPQNDSLYGKLAEFTWLKPGYDLLDFLIWTVFTTFSYIKYMYNECLRRESRCNGIYSHLITFLHWYLM